MIAGTLVLEDLVILFTNQDNGTTVVTINDTKTGFTETRTVNSHIFSQALSIAIHADGETNYAVDRPAAYALMETEFSPELNFLP